MPRTKKKTLKEMKAEFEVLQRDIELREREEMVEQLMSSKEFKSVARQVGRLGLNGEEIAEIFTATREAVKPRRKRIPRMKVKPKYRNPENSEQTWSGRGNRPKWIEQALANGLTLEELLIRE